MLNTTKYKVPNNTTPENKILWIINGLEQKVKKLEVINYELLEACKEMVINFDHRQPLLEEIDYLIKKAKQAISKAEGIQGGKV